MLRRRLGAMSSFFSDKHGQGHWTQIVSAVLVVVIIIVLIVLFATNIGQSQKSITQCTGVPGVEGLQGRCQASCPTGRQTIATASCPEWQVCCIG